MGKSPVTITLSRQMGSGGSYIGYLAAKELGFHYIDREILRQAAERLGTDPGALEHLDERSPGLIEKMMRGFSFGMPEISVPLPQKRPVEHKELFVLEGKIMHEIADRYSAVIVGRGGFYALKDRPKVIRVFIHAPQEFRVERIMKAKKINNINEIQAIVKESDHVRARFIREMAGVDWTDARNYHLCIDSSAFDFSSISAMIVKLAGQIEQKELL
jgi:CMP/dCMP kinase